MCHHSLSSVTATTTTPSHLSAANTFPGHVKVRTFFEWNGRMRMYCVYVHYSLIYKETGCAPLPFTDCEMSKVGWLLQCGWITVLCHHEWAKRAELVLLYDRKVIFDNLRYHNDAMSVHAYFSMNLFNRILNFALSQLIHFFPSHSNLNNCSWRR